MSRTFHVDLSFNGCVSPTSIFLGDCRVARNHGITVSCLIQAFPIENTTFFSPAP